MPAAWPRGRGLVPPKMTKREVIRILGGPTAASMLKECCPTAGVHLYPDGTDKPCRCGRMLSADLRRAEQLLEPST